MDLAMRKLSRDMATSFTFSFGGATNLLIPNSGILWPLVPPVSMRVVGQFPRFQRLLEVSFPVSRDRCGYGFRIELPIPEIMPDPLVSFAGGWIKVL